jgi:quercetin dioxygenase-like cupin family protein
MSERGSVVPPGGGRKVQVGPNTLLIKTERNAGHVQVGVFESTMPPGGGFPFAHIHDDWEEVFYVVDGEVEYWLGRAWLPASAGSTICVPAGVAHAFRNSSQHPAKHLVIHAPAAGLQAIEELGQAPRDHWDEILARYNSRFVGS